MPETMWGKYDDLAWKDRISVNKYMVNVLAKHLDKIKKGKK